MRTSGNPVKASPQLCGYKRHRIVVPVYIPNETGYYRDALRIFEISLKTLIATVDREKVNITVVDNASISDVYRIVAPYVHEGRVDQYLRNAVNRGRADVLISVAKSAFEPFVTTADGDALFEHGWLDAVESVYSKFPMAGVVCPYPLPTQRHMHTSSTWLSQITRVRHGAVADANDMREFALSLDVPDFFSAEDYRAQWHLMKDGAAALIGAGHFVATYRQVVFRALEHRPSLLAARGNRHIEECVDGLGLLRLSLPRAYVRHMGNVMEESFAGRCDEILRSAPAQGLVHEVHEGLSKGRFAGLPATLRRVTQAGVVGLTRIMVNASLRRAQEAERSLRSNGLG